MSWQIRGFAALLAALCMGGAVAADDSGAAAAQALRSRQEAIQAQLKNNAFGLPLVLESTEGDRDLSGDVYALLPQPLAAVSAALKRPAQWCEVLILHLNVKHCETTPSGLALNVGSKHDQPLEQTSRLELTQRVVADTPDYLRVEMMASRARWARATTGSCWS